jgi:hypothetical protein
MKSETEKVCAIEDTEEIRSVLTKGGKLTCSVCCASSDDPKALCHSVETPGCKSVL